MNEYIQADFFRNKSKKVQPSTADITEIKQCSSGKSWLSNHEIWILLVDDASYIGDVMII